MRRAWNRGRARSRPILLLTVLLGATLLPAGTPSATSDHGVASLSDARFTAELGRALFERDWVPAPSSARANDGLGPYFDARSCAACHPRGGRGVLQAGDTNPRALVTRLVRPHTRAGDPVYGRQLQTDAVPGLPGEASRVLTSPATPGAATSDHGRAPVARLGGLADGALHPDTRLAFRRAPSLTGVGRLAAVESASIRRAADPYDRDGDGISGRTGIDRDAPDEIGRFGSKATAATLEHIVAEAFQVDLGLSSRYRPNAYGDCTAHQQACRDRAHGVQADLGEYELPDDIIMLVVRYLKRLPAPRPLTDTPDPLVAIGRTVFQESGCADCHTPSLPLVPVSGYGVASVEAYTDLLVHDLGPALAEGGLGDRDPATREWRTTPLWGLTRDIGGGERVGYLHDARAPTPLAAVEWHGGEAARSRDRVRRLDPTARAALLRFLDAL